MEYTKSIFKEITYSRKENQNKSKFFSTMNSKTETYSNNLQSIIEQLEVQENHSEKVLNRLKEVYFSILDLKQALITCLFHILMQMLLKLFLKN